jgi:hypothetical protein
MNGCRFDLEIVVFFLPGGKHRQLERLVGLWKGRPKGEAKPWFKGFRFSPEGPAFDESVGVQEGPSLVWHFWLTLFHFNILILNLITRVSVFFWLFF